MSTQLRVICPAGEEVAEAADGTLSCRCRIARETITDRENNSSLHLFCTNPGRSAPGYTMCPIWTRHRKAERDGSAKALQAEIDATAPDQRQTPVAL